jgi:glutamate racemase
MDSSLHFEPNRRPIGACVGVFDSGVGGLSVLRALRERLPDASLLYVADSAHAPYGERSDRHVLDRSNRIIAHLVQAGAEGVVIACNTATAIAARSLRDAWPRLPIVGVEPGLKPAVAASRTGRIGVMATPGTLASEKFRMLLESQAANAKITLRPCPGLARLIEGADLDAPALLQAIAEHTAFLRAANVDTVVLGCTHYAFVRHHIQAAMGADVQIIDTADAVARHAVTRLDPIIERGASAALPHLQTTGDAERLRAIAAAWLPFACTVESIGADHAPRTS